MTRSLHSEANVQLVGLIIDARKTSGLTQQSVADRLGKPQSYIAKIEGGERRIDVPEFADLARAMDADPLALFEVFLKESGEG